MTVAAQRLEGPRGTRHHDLQQVMSLINRVFGADKFGDMYRRFPVLFADENLENCRIILDGGRPVSHVGYLVRDAVLNGPTVRLACIGAVCTLEEYRGRQLASTVLADCERRMREQAVDLVFISGGIGLYKRRGARTVSRQQTCAITAADTAALAGAPVEVSPAGPADLATLAALYDTNPVRHVRSETDWTRWLRLGRCENGPGAPYVARTGGQPVAYVVHRHANLELKPISDAVEWAGRPADVAAILPALLSPAARDKVQVTLDAVTDADLLEHLRAAGARLEPANWGRTVKVLRPAALFEKLRPHLPSPACDTRVTDVGEGARLELGSDAVDVPVEQLARLFFGDPEGAVPMVLRSAGRLGEALLRAFPFPLPRYGYNYT